MNLEGAGFKCARERSSALKKSWSDECLDISNGKYDEFLNEAEDFDSVLREVGYQRGITPAYKPPQSQRLE